MTRKRKLLLNSGMALVYQAVTIICGFVLPKFIIPYFGSATNGLINSITQLLTIITLCECGVGAVVQSALYKPLADNDTDSISKVVISSNRFFNRIMLMLGGYVLVLMVVYPIIVRDEFDFIYTAALVLILALSYIAQYYLFLTYRLLLNADQLSFVQLGAHSLTLIANTVLTIVLIKVGAPVHMVKLGSVAAFLIQPIAIKLYIYKHYKLNMKLKLTEEPIKQKWNGMAQHVAAVVQSNAPTVVLTLFSTMESISVYSVYYLVAHGIRQVILSLNTGVKAMLGNMLAKNETEILQKTFDGVELAFHTIVTLLFTIAGILMIPFVKIYTADFTDAEYIQPVFSVFMILAQATYCIRIPYEIMTHVAGHYKETQLSSIIEAAINIVTAIVFTLCFGFVGAAIGTVFAMAYRTVYLVFYMSKNILHRPIKSFLKHILVDVVCIGLMLLATMWMNIEVSNYFHWAIAAVVVTLICTAVCVIVNVIFYRRTFKSALKMLLKKAK